MPRITYDSYMWWSHVAHLWILMIDLYGFSSSTLLRDFDSGSWCHWMNGYTGMEGTLYLWHECPKSTVPVTCDSHMWWSQVMIICASHVDSVTWFMLLLVCFLEWVRGTSLPTSCQACSCLLMAADASKWLNMLACREHFIPIKWVSKITCDGHMWWSHVHHIQWSTVMITFASHAYSNPSARFAPFEFSGPHSQFIV